MKLIAYNVHDTPGLEIRKGSIKREWMENTTDRYAYRCIPLSIANSSGWDIILDQDIILKYDGGNRREDLQIYSSKSVSGASHFGHGIATFHSGHLFQTEPGWSLWVRGSPNVPFDGIQPLDGIVETSWLPFTFTINYRMTRPGKVILQKGTSLAFITPIRLSDIEAFEPEIKNLSENTELIKSYDKYAKTRQYVLDNPEKTKENTKFYVKGQDSEKNNIAIDHKKSMKLKDFVFNTDL